MNVYIFDSPSLLEGLYLQTLYEGTKVNFVFNISEADVVIGCNSTDLIYEKTIIINNNNFDNSHLMELSKFNKIISRFPINSLHGVELKLEPYQDLKLNNFEFDGSTKNALSRLSIKDFVITKSGNTYRMKKSQMFANKEVGGSKTIIGLLYDQIS